jgi:hypothetical protein
LSYLCGIEVGISAEVTQSNPKTTRKIVRLVRYISSHRLKSITYTSDKFGLLDITYQQLLN